jgi:DNA-3-methyladenine glycosylase II
MTLQYDPVEAALALAKADKRLGRVIAKVGPFTHRPEAMQSPFEALLRAIVYQQLSGKAAATIHGRVMTAIARRNKLHPQAILDTPDQTLRAAGMSRAKVLAVQDLAAKTLDGTVPTLARLKKMDDAEILSRLVSVRGIGPWTVEMLLIFRLGRPDVLPASDLGVRAGTMVVHRLEALPTPTEVLRIGERWRPYRSVASWYLWRAVDLARQASKT